MARPFLCTLNISSVRRWHRPLWLMKDGVPGFSLSSKQQSSQHCAQQMIVNAVVSFFATLKQQPNQIKLHSLRKWGLLKWKRRRDFFFLTISIRLSAICSSDPGRSFVFGLPWRWRARVTPAMATTRARRDTSTEVSMMSNSGGGRKTKAGWDAGRWSPLLLERASQVLTVWGGLGRSSLNCVLWQWYPHSV